MLASPHQIRGDHMKITDHMNFTESVSFTFSQSTELDGRASRSEFWYFILFDLVVAGTLFGFGFLMGKGGQYALPIIALLGLIMPTCSVMVRRLHDTGRHGAYAWMMLIPGVNLLPLTFLLLPGHKGANQHGF